MRVEPLDFDLHWRRAHPFPWGRNDAINPFVCHFGTSQGSSTQTTTQNNTPWSAQQPYLTTGFSTAQNLLNQPAPQQQNPVAPLNDTENSALSGIIDQANAGSSIIPAANNFATNLQNGDYLNSNPSSGYFTSLAGSNLGLSNPGATDLTAIAGSNPGTNLPGSSTLQNYANGGYFSNAYSDPTATSIESQVIPQVAAAFNGGNDINNPSAAFAAGQGVTNALAPIEYQNYQTQEGLQQQAANTLGANSLAGSNIQAGAANNLNSGALSGGNLQATAAEGISQPYQQTLTSMVQGNALAPQDQSLNYSDLNEQLAAGQTQQTQAQNQATGAASTYNFSQMSPYEQLAAYMQAVTGSYGGTQSGSTTTPYYTNQTANTLGDVTGAASIASALIPFL